MNKVLVGIASHVIVHSQSDKNTILEQNPSFKGQLDVFPLPLYGHYRSSKQIDPDEARMQLGLKQDNVVLFFGIIRPYKGLDVLLDAFAALLLRMPNSFLVVAGKLWISEEKIKKQIMSLGLEDNVRLITRWIEDDEIPILFAASDIAVFPYKTASHSAALMTALSFPVEIVGTKVGGIYDTLKSHKNAVLVPPNDAKSLTDGMETALANKAARNFANALEGTLLGWEEVASKVLAFWTT
jgi:glycosyltransferase involved in cell wall biosynthesis